MPLKILHLTSTRGGGIGGAEKLLLDLSERYDENRFLIAYCNVLSESGAAEKFVRVLRERELNSFAIEGNQYKDVPKIVYELTHLIRAEKFDIVHAHLLHASVIGYLATSLTQSAKLIITRHYTNDVAYLNKPFFLAKLDARAARGATKVLAVSSEVKNDLLKQGVSPERVEIVHNGIDLLSFDKAALSAENFLQHWQAKYLLATVGNLHPRKGHANLIHSLAKLSEKISNVHLLILGEGAERARLERLIDDLRLKERVSILGFRPDVASILKRIDLYVHPSIYEPFGIAILEAMAARKCVIATDVGGVSDIVINGQTGVLVPSLNENALINAILHANQNPRRNQEMGDAGRRVVEQHFRIESVAEKYQRLYEFCV